MKTTRIDKLVLVREQIEQGIKPDTGAMMPHFQRCGFPLRRQPKGYLKHERWDGDVKLTILQTEERFGMPFGADILTLLWCFTAALERNSRTVKLKAAAAILRDMGLPPKTFNYHAVMRSFERIFGCAYTFEWMEVFPGRGKRIHRQKAFLFDRLSLWFHEDERQLSLEDEDESFANVIVLSEFAWNWLQSSERFPVEPAYALRQVPGAIQLYFMIVSRGPRLRGKGDLVEIPVTGPEGLDKQLGGKTYVGEAQRRWRQLLRKWIDEIGVGWPDCPVDLVDLTGCTRYGKSKQGWYLRIGWFPKNWWKAARF